MQAKAEYAGKITHCPKCEEEVQIPGAAIRAGAPPRPRAAAALPAKALPRRGEDDDDYEDDDEERSEPRSMVPWIAGGAVLLLLLAFGSLMAWYVMGKKDSANDSSSVASSDKKSDDKKGGGDKKLPDDKKGGEDDKKGGDDKKGSVENKGPSGPDADLSLIPNDAQLFATVRIADVWNSPAFQDALRQSSAGAKLTTQAREMFGLEPADVERATYVLRNAQTQQMWILIQTAKPFDQKALLQKFEKLATQKSEERKHKTKTYYALGKSVLHFVSDRLFVFAPSEALTTVLDLEPRTKAEGPLAKALELAAAGKNHLVAGTGPLPQQIQNELRQNPQLRNPQYAPYLVFLDMQDAILTLDVKQDSHLALALSFPGADKAKEAERAVNHGLKTLVLPSIAAAKQTPNLPPDVKKSLAEAETALTNFKPTVDGAVLRLEMRSPLDSTAMAKVMTDLAQGRPPIVLPGPGPGPGPGPKPDPKPDPKPVAGTKGQSMDNLRKIGAAMHRYHKAKGHFPPAIVYGGLNGRTRLYGWRVELLPYLDDPKAKALYAEWKKDELWSSPNNARLLSRMPEVYALPGEQANKGQTYYKIFIGNGMPFLNSVQPGKTTPKLTDFQDGTANTVLVAESAKAAPWAAPLGDLVFNVNPRSSSGFPAKELGGHHGDDSILLLMADGSVRMTTRKIDPKVLQALLTPKGSEVVPPDWASK
jgi:hypothetical protein